MGTEPEIEIGSVPEKEMVSMPENEMGGCRGSRCGIEEGGQGHSGHEVCNWAYAHTLLIGLDSGNLDIWKANPRLKFLDLSL